MSETMQPVFEVLENFAAPDAHRAALAVCNGKGWYFGNASNKTGTHRFWKLDLEQEPVFQAIWNEAKPRCEALAGVRLKLLRVYANGHTFGQGGEPHQDDSRPGSYTLLYYPHGEWDRTWDGDTVVYDEKMEIEAAILPLPNRAVFFDSRILHKGRAPSRDFHGLRITVAFKLIADGELAAAPAPEPFVGKTISIEIPEEQLQNPIAEYLQQMNRTVRLPEYPAGQIPSDMLQERYGASARAHALQRVVAQLCDEQLRKGFVAVGGKVLSGAESGSAVVELTGTELSDLPEVDFSVMQVERLTGPAELAGALQAHLSRQVLTQLDALYRFPVPPGLVAREFEAVWKVAEQQELPPEGPDLEEARRYFGAIAERRVRVGIVIQELARRWGMQAQSGSELEQRVLQAILAQVPLSEREATAVELAGLS